MNALPLTLASLASQRVAAHGRLGVRFTGGRTRIAELYQEGAAKLRIPRQDVADLEAVLINTSGGLTGGDHVEWEAGAAAGTKLVLTTQAYNPFIYFIF
jgi:urease accessory protein